MMKRTLVPEILDELPENHPTAQRLRDDMHGYNRLMGTFGWFNVALRKSLMEGDRILEIGAGRGDLQAYLDKQGVWGARKSGRGDGLDLCSRPKSWPENANWIQADLKEFDGFRDYDVVLANLILHQFTDADLERIGRRLQNGPRLIIANELRRARLHIAQTYLTRLLGYCTASMHDAVASIHGGFRTNELARKLGLDSPKWKIAKTETWLGAYRLIAWRR